MAKMSKKKYCLKTLRTTWNVLSAKYDGFEWVIELEHRFDKTKLVLSGDCQALWIKVPGKDNTAVDVSVLTYEFAKNLGRIINKNARNYKDPFKGITGWC